MASNKYLISWTKLCLLSSIIIGTGNYAHSVTLISMDFEKGLPAVDTPMPVWALPTQFANVSGAGNHFEIVNNIAHSGNASLRLDPNARNGYCNTCGGKMLQQHLDADGANFFMASTGEDLTVSANKGPAAQKGRILYNLTKGFSKWEITSVENASAINDKLIVKQLLPGINNDPDIFNADDKIYITRQCGVDGNFTKNINQRNDCNPLINIFNNVGGTQSPGQSIFRRLYIRMDVVKPANFKLRYWTSNLADPANATHVYLDATGGASRNDFPIEPFVVTVNVEKAITGHLKGDGKTAAYLPGTGPYDLPAGLNFERGKWYYIEEELRASTLDPTDTTGKIYNDDGEYRLWMSEAGKEDSDGTEPILEILKMRLPVVERASFWGNFQHITHTIGQIYIDDLEIASDTKIGAKVSNGTNIYPPAPPIVAP